MTAISEAKEKIYVEISFEICLNGLDSSIASTHVFIEI